MDEPEEEPWDPANEVDPAKVQKEYLEVAKDLVAEMKADKARKAKEKEEYEGAIAAVPAIGGIAAYQPPTFQELSAKLKRCWEETKKIAPDAPEFVQAEIIRTLLHAPMEDGNGYA